jgi:hypothetical protein
MELEPQVHKKADTHGSCKEKKRQLSKNSGHVYPFLVQASASLSESPIIEDQCNRGDRDSPLQAHEISNQTRMSHDPVSQHSKANVTSSVRASIRQLEKAQGFST